METISTYKNIINLFCPTCHKPRDELIDAVGEGLMFSGALIVTLPWLMAYLWLQDIWP